MIIKINAEQPFQVLSTTFSIGPSSSGYDLMASADGVNYSKLFTVGANTNRQVTQVAAGSYYYLAGNTGNVVVNWFGNCVVDNGGGGSYVLPVASQDTLGGVKIGSGLTMSGDTLNANPGGYTLPIASENVLGGVKIGSGITIDSGGTISAQGGGTQYTAGNGIDLSGSTISVKIGDGLAFSGNTIVVSGGTGGGIEKVTELPANPEEGDIVQLYVSGKTVQTIAMEMTISEKSFESGYQVAVINGNGFECDGYGTQYGKWVHDYSFGFDVYLRNRRSADYRYFDFEVDAADITLGSDADSLTETVIPGYYQLWEFSQGEWKQIDREIVFDTEFDGSVADFYWRVYSGVNFIDTDYITIRHKDENNKREFKPYDFKYYGMDCQATDGRGAKDGKWGQIGVESARVNESGINAAVQKEYTATENIVPSIVYASFGNDDRGGLTYDADNDQFLYDNGTVATGDTSNYVEDIIDYNYLNSLFSRTGRFNVSYVMNTHVLNVQSSGETHYYAQPSLVKKPITGYTIGDYTFVWEFTFKYADYVLKIDAPDGVNLGANLRIAQA